MNSHDHSGTAILRRAEDLCRRRGARLTAMRRRVFAELAAADGPIGAYAVLDRLNADGARVKPMSVYRALDFLAEHGLVHKLAGRSAYVACDHPEGEHAALFLICRACGAVAERDAAELDAALAACAGAAGFQPAAKVLEVEGLCRGCQGHG